MSAPFFFTQGAGLSLGQIATLTGGEPRAGADLDRRIRAIAPLDRAGPSDLAFLESAKYAQQAAMTVAGVCLTTTRFRDALPDRVNVIMVREPYRAFVEVARTLFPDALRPSSLFEAAGGTSSGAHVHPLSTLR